MIFYLPLSLVCSVGRGAITDTMDVDVRTLMYAISYIILK